MKWIRVQRRVTSGAFKYSAASSRARLSALPFGTTSATNPSRKLADEGAELKVRKPDQRSGQESVRRAHRAGAMVALGPLRAFNRDEMLEDSKPRILGDVVSV